MDGFCNKNDDQLGSLAGLSFPTVYVGVVDCAPASLPPASSSLTHARRMDGFCNQNADQLSSLAGPSLLTLYVGVVDCAPASPYTYSSSTHRFPDERTTIETTPLSATKKQIITTVTGPGEIQVSDVERNQGKQGATLCKSTGFLTGPSPALGGLQIP